MEKQLKYLRPENEMPEQWYNLAADLPSPLDPPLNPATGKPATPEDLGAIFPGPIIEQEMSTERWIGIPERANGAPPSPLPAPSSGWTVPKSSISGSAKPKAFSNSSAFRLV